MKEYNYEMVKNARSLFFSKGIMNRDILRKDISISWARSQMFSVNRNKYTKSNIQYIKEIILEEKNEKIYSEDLICILGINKSGNPIINFYSKIEDLNFFEVNFSTNSIGTNGIGMALINNKSSWTNPCENYNELLDDYTIIGIPNSCENEEIIIGYIYNNKIINSTDIKFFEEYSNEIIERIPKKNDENQKNFSYKIDKFANYFTGNSKVYLDFLDKFNSLKILNSNIFIEGKKGTGKEILARLFHEESQNRNKNFLPIYCDKIPEEIFINEYIKSFLLEAVPNQYDKIGTIYFESIDSLSYKSQEQLTRLLESKPVNSKLTNASFTKQYRFLFSSESSLEYLKNKNYILERLLSRINVMTIKIPEIKEMKLDLKELIYSRIEKFSKKYYLDKIEFSDELIDKLIENDWQENYRELDKVIEGIIRIGRHERLVGIEYYGEFFKSNIYENNCIKPINTVEKEHIERVLKILNFNLLEASKVLGISRSTLYRKIEKYNIEI